MSKYKLERLKNRYINKLIILDSCDSTMDIANIWHNEDEPVLILAEQQNKGRGQKQRTWLSPYQAGIWATLVIHGQFSELSKNTALALAETLIELGCPEPINVKWPNDILLSGKKTAGILIEGYYQNNIQAWHIGIGLTIKHVDIPDTMPLEQHWPNHPDRETIIVAFIEHLFTKLDYKRSKP